MQVSDLTFEVRNASLQRVAILQPGDGLTTFKATVRFNNVGTWEITIPETSPRADLLRTPGYGIIVTGPGGVLFSGPTTAATNQKTSGSPIGVWAIRGATDNIVLGEHLAYPTPATADVTLQSSAYDAYTAVASTVMYYYVKRNMVSSGNGGSAPSARAVTGLTCATDTAIGSSIIGKARFDNIGTLMQSIAATSTTQLGFDVKQSGTNIQFSVYQPTDRTGSIRLDVANNTLQKASYGYGYGPNHVIVAGQGQGTARAFVETSNTTSETNWSRRVERFVDQRNETDTTKLTQAGNDLLAQEGGNITSLDIVPTNDSTMTYGVDFNLGDKVTVTVGSQEITGIVTTAQFDVKIDGLWVGLTVGNATGFDYDAVMMKRQTDTSARVSALEKSEALSGTIPVSVGGVPSGGSTGQMLTKTSGSDYAVTWSSYYMSPNCVINGAFDIWQRNTTSTTQGYATADRWYHTSSGATWARDSSNVVAGTQYSLRATMSSASQPLVYQAVETLNAVALSGQTVTLSAYLASNVSVVGLLRVEYSTAVDNSVTGTWTAINSATPTLTSTLTQYALTVAIPSSAKSIRITCGTNANLASTNTFTVGAVQLEIGSSATPFRRNSNSVQGELAACQRYFVASSTTGSQIIWSGNCTSGAGYITFGTFPVPMRIAPTAAVTLTNGSLNSSFPTTPGTPAGITATGFYEIRTASASNANGYFSSNFTANAEL